MSSAPLSPAAECRVRVRSPGPFRPVSQCPAGRRSWGCACSSQVRLPSSLAVPNISDVGLPRGLHTSVGSPTPSSKRFGKFRQVRVVARHRHVLRWQAEAVLHPPVEYHLPSACVRLRCCRARCRLSELFIGINANDRLRGPECWYGGVVGDVSAQHPPAFPRVHAQDRGDSVLRDCCLAARGNCCAKCYGLPSELSILLPIHQLPPLPLLEKLASCSDDFLQHDCV